MDGVELAALKFQSETQSRALGEVQLVRAPPAVVASVGLDVWFNVDDARMELQTIALNAADEFGVAVMKTGDDEAVWSVKFYEPLVEGSVGSRVPAQWRA